MGRKSRDNKPQLTAKSKKINLKIVGALLVTIIIFGVAGLLVASSYTGFASPPIPKSIVRFTDVAIASFPSLPKTANQVLSKSFFETSRVSSGDHKFKLDLTRDIGQEESQSLLNLEISGPFKKTNDQIDLAGRAVFKLPGSNEESRAEFVELEDFVYFKVDHLPGVSGLDLSKLEGSWYKLDVTKILSDAKAETKKDGEIEKTISEKIKLILNTLDSENLIQNLEVLPDETVGGNVSYHYRINLSEESTKKLLDQLTGGSKELPSLGESSIDLWINKTSFIMDKLVITSTIKTPQDKSTPNLVLKEPNVNFNLTYELSDPNGSVGINPPAPVKEVSSLVDLYLAVKGTENTDPSASVLGVVNNLGEFGANFLTIERLIHVLYLTPQAF